MIQHLMGLRPGCLSSVCGRRPWWSLLAVLAATMSSTRQATEGVLPDDSLRSRKLAGGLFHLRWPWHSRCWYRLWRNWLAQRLTACIKAGELRQQIVYIWLQPIALCTTPRLLLLTAATRNSRATLADNAATGLRRNMPGCPHICRGRRRTCTRLGWKASSRGNIARRACRVLGHCRTSSCQLCTQLCMRGFSGGFPLLCGGRHIGSRWSCGSCCPHIFRRTGAWAAATTSGSLG